MTRRDTLQLLARAGGAGIGVAAFGPGFVRAAAGQALPWQTARGSGPTFARGAVIRALAKDVSPPDLASGATLFHEHLGGSFTPAPSLGTNDIRPGPYNPSNEAEYLDLMSDELAMAKADGVVCVVDAALGRRNAQVLGNLRQMSTRSGVHVVAAGGYYQDLSMPATYPDEMKALSEDALADQLATDAVSQRWGAFGEIASSPQMQAEERRLLRAVGKAHVRTGLPVFTHTPHEGCPACAFEQLDVLESVGVDPRRVCIGHIATIKPGSEPLGQTAKALAKRGAFVGFDTVGHPMGRSAIPEAHKVRHVLALLEAGYEQQLLLSADSTPVPQMKANWGNGYGSVLVQFVPKLRYAGVKDSTLHTLLVDNPRRFLAFQPQSL